MLPHDLVGPRGGNAWREHGDNTTQRDRQQRKATFAHSKPPLPNSWLFLKPPATVSIS
jgi:hypothetical protein